MRYTLLFFISIFSYHIVAAQLQYFTQESMTGYTLFLGDSLYLVNNCGEKVNTWESVSPRYHVKLLPNGNIVYNDWNTNAVVERDWDNNLVNSVGPVAFDITLDYEVIVLENGNYLCLARKAFSQEEFMNIGYNSEEIGFTNKIDAVIEMDRNSGEIVWQWNISDHVIQERSDTIPNYGSVFDHPELLNLDAISTFDWQNEESWMINGMDYNPTLDQIVLSVRKMGEIIIIDHSTTTEEAAGHTGGNSGMGGDILYRWGNPQNYNRGTAADQQLFYQHNPNWIEHEEHAGKIAIYNNGLNRPDISYNDRYSNAPIIAPPIIAGGNYFIDDQMAFEPAMATVDYGIPGSIINFYSNYTSATKILENGNVLITVGDDNRIIELKPDGTLVWEYILPTAFFTFRAEKYYEDYPAFDEKELTPQGTIEMPSSTVPCEIISSTQSSYPSDIQAWIDHQSRLLYIQTSGNQQYDLALYDMLGQQLEQLNWPDNGATAISEKVSVPIPEYINGIFILNIRNRENGQQTSIKLYLP